MRKLYIVRHAEPALRNVFLGRMDPPLSPEGCAMAATALRHIEAAVVYSSPLRRALETAHAAFGPDRIVALPELAEMAFGEWEGSSWQEILDRWPELAARKTAAWQSETPPGGESWAAVEERIGRALEIIQRGPFPAVVVAHLAVNSVLAQWLLQADPLTFQQDYCESIFCEL
ncbi:MAG: histidine phosphatase family protein [Bryobacteraceae bacterium]